jgi:hypothetical protein
LALAGCSEELPPEVSTEESSSAGDQSSSEVDSSVTADTSSLDASSADEESSAEASSEETSSEPEESSEETSSESEASSEETPSEPEESSEEIPSEPEASSEETSSEPEESSEEPSSEPEESSEEIPSEPEESSEEIPSEPEESSEETSSEPEESSEELPYEPDGSGTEEDPYLYIPKENEPVTTVEIAGGAFYHYAIYRVGGMDLVIESNDVYVIYEGVTYTPENGVLSLRVERELASTAILFVIGNNGSETQRFSLSFSSPLGSMSNPEILTSFAEDRVVSLEANDEMGYFFRYVATQSGTIRFYFSATQSSMIVATNNRSSAQRSSEESDALDEQGRRYFDIQVEAGDELIINMGAIPNRRGKYPATVITWCAEYLA